MSDCLEAIGQNTKVMIFEKTNTFYDIGVTF